MLAIIVGFALLSAYLNAQAATFQRQATGQVAAKDLFRRNILQTVMHNKLWLGGIGLQVLGFFAQAIALANGSLTIVAPLLTTDLVFLVAILHFFVKHRMGRLEWSAVLLLCAGLASLLLAMAPHGGSPAISFARWWPAAGIVTLLLVAGALAMRQVRYIPVRAVLGGAVAGLHFAFTAVATKMVLAQLRNGIGHIFLGWQLYVLIAFGVTSALSMQSMYGSGPLTITQPSLEIIEAGAGIAFGILVFNDHVNRGAGSLIITALGGAVLFVGILLLASSKRLQTDNSL